MTRGRCPTCATLTRRAREATRGPRPQYQGDWPRISKQAIADYRGTHGDTCPGFGIPPHEIDPSEWVTDHDLGPMCRRCNSRKAATIDKGGGRSQSL